MLQSVSLNTNNTYNSYRNCQKKASNNPEISSDKNLTFSSNKLNKLTPVNTVLSDSQKEKYVFLMNYLKDAPISSNSDNMSCNKQLDYLLKSGKLLAKSGNDGSTTLDNLYDIATVERAYELNPVNLISNTLDLLINPRFVTQNFGDIPDSDKKEILNSLPQDSEVRKNPSLMDVEASGTCAAASNEVNLADKYPAEFARWISKLSGKNQKLYIDVDMDSISKNTLDAITILNLLEAKKDKFGLNKTRIEVDIDNNAYFRAKIQDKNWTKGERNVADVLVQSAIMRLGSQNTYDSLTDIRGGKFNSNPQGLIEVEKTFVESLIKNKEITSLTYQKIDDDQNLVGYNCSFDKIEKHITDTIDAGEDVIIGYVLTNETSGRTISQYYNPQTDGKPQKVINGHEITIVDYIKDENGKTSFICIDTDDDTPDYVQYSAQWLLPKIHHAGYPAYIVEADEKDILKNAAA